MKTTTYTIKIMIKAMKNWFEHLGSVIEDLANFQFYNNR